MSLTETFYYEIMFQKEEEMNLSNKKEKLRLKLGLWMLFVCVKVKLLQKVLVSLLSLNCSGCMSSMIE